MASRKKRDEYFDERERERKARLRASLAEINQWMTAQKEQRKAEQEMLTQLFNRQGKIDIDEHLTNFSKISREHHDWFIQLGLKYMAKFAAAGDANTSFDLQFQFQDVQFDLDELQRQITRIMRAEVFVHLLQSSQLDKKAKELMLKRYIARLLPKKDNIKDGADTGRGIDVGGNGYREPPLPR